MTIELTIRAVYAVLGEGGRPVCEVHAEPLPQQNADLPALMSARLMLGAYDREVLPAVTPGRRIRVVVTAVED